MTIKTTVKNLWKNDLVKIAVVLLIIFLVLKYFKKFTEGLDVSAPATLPIATNPNSNQMSVAIPSTMPVSTPVNAQLPQQMNMPSEDSQMNFITCAGQTLSATDLLPTNAEASSFAQNNPNTLLTDQNFLISGFSMGLNSRGGSNKNPNLQLRSDPVIPATSSSVGPWNNSTISYDPQLRKTFDIGSA